MCDAKFFPSITRSELAYSLPPLPGLGSGPASVPPDPVQPVDLDLQELTALFPSGNAHPGSRLSQRSLPVARSLQVVISEPLNLYPAGAFETSSSLTVPVTYTLALVTAREFAEPAFRATLRRTLAEWAFAASPRSSLPWCTDVPGSGTRPVPTGLRDFDPFVDLFSSGPGGLGRQSPSREAGTIQSHRRHALLIVEGRAVFEKSLRKAAAARFASAAAEVASQGADLSSGLSSGYVPIGVPPLPCSRLSRILTSGLQRLE